MFNNTNKIKAALERISLLSKILQNLTDPRFLCKTYKEKKYLSITEMCVSNVVLMIHKYCSCLSGLCCGGRWTGSSERWPQLAPPCLSPSARARRGQAALSPYALSPGYSSTTVEMRGTDCTIPVILTFSTAFISLSQVNLCSARHTALKSSRTAICLSEYVREKKLLYSGKLQSSKQPFVPVRLVCICCSNPMNHKTFM